MSKQRIPQRDSNVFIAIKSNNRSGYKSESHEESNPIPLYKIVLFSVNPGQRRVLQQVTREII